MAEKVVIGNATLYHGDALEVLPLLPAVDAVITEPPFNAGKAIANDNLDPKAWRAFCNRLALALWANGAPNVLVETGKDDATMRQELERWIPYRYAVMLNYTNSMRNGAVGFANFGLVYWFGDGKCHERYMDRLDAALISTKDEFTHPTPKMVPHYARLVDNKASACGNDTGSYEGWLRVARGGWAPSMVASAAGVVSGVDAL